MKREDLKRSICLVKGRFGKPDLNQVEVEGRSLMVKDVRRKIFSFAMDIRTLVDS